MKPRILYLMKILYERTDETRGLSLPEIQAHLEGYGVSSERKSLYRDIAALDEFGFTIGKIPRRPVQYYYSNRLFTTPELLLLIDAVQSSRSITQANSEELISKLKSLISAQQAQDIRSQLHVTGRVKVQNESVFDTLDKIQRAIAQKLDISFHYMRMDSHMQMLPTKSNGDKLRVKTPLFLTYTDEHYYLGVYDEDSHDHLKIYRVDRMDHVLLLDRSPASHKLDPDFDIAEYERRTPGMFDDEPVRITLHVKESLVGSIVDIFGKDDTTSFPIDEDRIWKEDTDRADSDRWAQMSVKAAPSPVLFGKIAQFGGDVRIIGPKKVRRAYETHIASIVRAQQRSDPEPSSI